MTMTLITGQTFLYPQHCLTVLFSVSPASVKVGLTLETVANTEGALSTSYMLRLPYCSSKRNIRKIKYRSF